jgi:CHAT domain-containing protein/Tfp pilus assembly protein PilF
MKFAESAHLGLLVATAVAFCLPSESPPGLRLNVSPIIATESLQDEQEAAQVEPGKSFERALAGRESHTYQIMLSADQYAGISVDQQGIDVVAQVLDQEGKLIADFDSESRTQGQEKVAIVSGSPGTYQIRVKAKYPKMPGGRYELKCVEIRAANEQDRDVFQARRLSTEAGVLSDSGKYEEASERVQRALDLGKKALGPDDPFVGALAIRLGLALRNKGDFAKAEPILQSAVSISQQALGEDDPQTAAALQNLGLLYRSLDEGAKAEQLLQRALEIYKKSLGAEHPRIAFCLTPLAGQYQDRGDFEQAIATLQQALAIADKTLDSDDFLPMALVHNLGDIYLNQGDTGRAEPLTERALQMAEKKYGPDHPNVALPLQNLGSIARQKREYPRALEMFSRAQRIREKALGPQHPRTVSLLINIGNVYKDEGDYAKAREYYQKALELLQVSAGPYHTLTLMALANLSSVHSAMSDTARALEYQARVNAVVEKNIELNLAIGSEREKLTYTTWIEKRTDRVVSLHIREAPNDKMAGELAAQVLLQRKARVFDAVSGNLVALRRHLGADGQKLLDDREALTAKLAKVTLSGPGKSPPSEYSKQLSALEEQREKIETEITRISAGYYEQSGAPTLPAVRSAIPAEAVLVEFIVYRPFDAKAVDTGDKPYGDPRYAVYVIPARGDIGWRDLGRAKDIDAAVQALREALRNSKRNDARKLARSLDERVMQPIRPLVGNAKHLLLSPDGELNLVPFEALLSEQDHYLVEDYAVTYLTTGRDLLRMQVGRESKSSPLVVADPLFGEPPFKSSGQEDHEKLDSAKFTKGRRSITTGPDFSSVYFARLSGTAQEARNIQRLFPEAKVLTGQEATKSALKQVEAPRILHIATHGFFLEDAEASASPEAQEGGATNSRAIQANVRVQNPLLRSGLALSGANLIRSGTEEGILTALEASSLDLWGTKLVTLSACDTGLGEVKNGEGVYGLRRAFFLAGTESLVMSLWPVSDYVTRELMVQYYAGLKKGLGRGEALRQAQLAMLKRKGRQHPFYWASFIQSGEWANLDGKR